MPASSASSGPARQSGLQRVTVNLTPRAYEALKQAEKLTGDSRTDTINRAIHVYAYIMNITQNDGAVYVRDNGSSELERLQIL